MKTTAPDDHQERLFYSMMILTNLGCHLKSGAGVPPDIFHSSLAEEPCNGSLRLSLFIFHSVQLLRQRKVRRHLHLGDLPHLLRRGGLDRLGDRVAALQ